MSVPLPDVPGVLKMNFTWTYGSAGNVMSHLFFACTGLPTSQANMNLYANIAQASYHSNLQAYMPSPSALTHIQCLDLSDVSSPVGSWSGNLQGSGGGSPVPAETACLINLKIARRYKGGKPRLYWPAGESGDFASPQSWTNAFLSNFGNAFFAFLNGIQNQPPPPPALTGLVSVSYYHGSTGTDGKPILRVTPLVDPVTSVSLNPKPASQRRRMAR